MEKQIVKIERASEETIKFLLKVGILYIGDDDQIHVAEKSS